MRRRLRRAARRRVLRGRVECVRDGGVRPLGGQRQMERALLAVRYALGQAVVHVPPRAWARQLDDGGREQRVREGKAPTLVANELRVQRGRQRGFVEHVDRRCGEQGGREQRVEGGARHARDAVPHDRADLVGRGQRLARCGWLPGGDHSMRELERHERVSARALVDPAQQRARERSPEPGVDDVMHGTERHGPDRHPGERLVAQQ
jgi:hypothetical protein